jgi:hypothetical protein
MKVFERAVAALAVLFLGLIALHPFLKPEIAQAQVSGGQVYIEPGINIIRSPDKEILTQGKIVVDLTTGKIWGFPTQADTPYLVDPLKPKALLSSPIFLGKFDFEAMNRLQ